MDIGASGPVMNWVYHLLILYVCTETQRQKLSHKLSITIKTKINFLVCSVRPTYLASSHDAHTSH